MKNKNDVTEIIPGLWLGNYKAAYNKKFLADYNIKNIISVMDNFDMNYKYNNICYFTVPIRDSNLVNMNYVFNSTIYCIHNSLMMDQNILVHCKRGHHRSASIVAAYLIKYKNYNYLDAIQKINNVRPLALRRDTNISRALYDYNLYIHGQKPKHKDCKIKNGLFYCN